MCVSEERVKDLLRKKAGKDVHISIAKTDTFNHYMHVLCSYKGRLIGQNCKTLHELEANTGWKLRIDAYAIPKEDLEKELLRIPIFLRVVVLEEGPIRYVADAYFSEQPRPWVLRMIRARTGWQIQPKIDPKIEVLGAAIRKFLLPGTAFKILSHNFPEAVVACAIPKELRGVKGVNIEAIQRDTEWHVKVVQFRGDLINWIADRLSADAIFRIEEVGFAKAHIYCTDPGKLRGVKSSGLKEARRETGWNITEVFRCTIPFSEMEAEVRRFCPSEIDVQSIEELAYVKAEREDLPKMAIIRCRNPRNADTNHLEQSLLAKTGFVICFLSTEELAKSITFEKFRRYEPEILVDTDQLNIVCKGPPPSPGSYIELSAEVSLLTGYKVRVSKQPVSEDDLRTYLQLLLPEGYPAEVGLFDNNVARVVVPCGGILVGLDGAKARQVTTETGWQLEVTERPVALSEATAKIQRMLKSIVGVCRIIPLFQGNRGNAAPVAVIECHQPELVLTSPEVKSSLEYLRLFTGWVLRLRVPESVAAEAAQQAPPSIGLKELRHANKDTLELFCEKPDADEARTFAITLSNRTGWNIKILPSGLLKPSRSGRVTSIRYRKCPVCRGHTDQTASGAGSRRTSSCLHCQGKGYLYSSKPSDLASVDEETH